MLQFCMAAQGVVRQVLGRLLLFFWRNGFSFTVACPPYVFGSLAVADLLDRGNYVSGYGLFA